MSKVIVAGSINMDVVALAERHPLVGETVLGRELHFFPGGKGANQAVAAAKLGAQTILVGKLGNDSFGDELKSFLMSQGVNLDQVQRTSAATTGTALIVVADTSDNTIVIVPGANDLLTPDDTTQVAIEKGDVLVSQFEIPDDSIERFFRRGKSVGATTILNPAPAKPSLPDVLGLADVLVVNETELKFFLETDCLGALGIPSITQAARHLRTHREQVVVVTLGENGAVAIAEDQDIQVPGRRVKAIDTTGAGDCFVGALAASLATGATLERALSYANLAASICVQRLGAGTSMPRVDEVAEEAVGV